MIIHWSGYTISVDGGSSELVVAITSASIIIICGWWLLWVVRMRPIGDRVSRVWDFSSRLVSNLYYFFADHIEFLFGNSAGLSYIEGLSWTDGALYERLWWPRWKTWLSRLSDREFDLSTVSFKFRLILSVLKRADRNFLYSEGVKERTCFILRLRWLGIHWLRELKEII